MIKFLKGRPTHCRIDHAAVRWNLRQIKKTIGPRVKILSMVKANAYGHGAVEVARTLAKSGSDAFGVATVEEGIELRRAQITQPILVLAGVYLGQVDQFLRNRLTPVIHEAATLRALDKALRARKAKLKIQLEIDTGMGRIGFPTSEIDSWLPLVSQLKALTLDGVFSIFPMLKPPTKNTLRDSWRNFTKCSVVLRARKFFLPPATWQRAPRWSQFRHPISRWCGRDLFFTACIQRRQIKKQIALKPVLSWRTRIIQLKRSPARTPIGYGRTFVTKRNSLIATLPVGYADGYRRLLSNHAVVLVRGKRAPVVGRVSMDLTTVDVTDIRKVQQGDEVVLLGRQGAAEISADEMAAWANTISYEIFTSIGARVPRIHINF